MNRRKWLWTALLALPLAVAGVVYANSQQARSYVCPITGEELPCPNCCPLNKSQQAKTQQAKSEQARSKQTKEQSYVCPITGEELPCEKCCPLNEQK